MSEKQSRSFACSAWRTGMKLDLLFMPFLPKEFSQATSVQYHFAELESRVLHLYLSHLSSSKIMSISEIPTQGNPD